MAAPEPGRGGDLVLDPYNRRLKLYGPTSDEVRDPGLEIWKQELQDCADLYTKLIVYARPGGERSWTVAGYQREGSLAGFFDDGEAAHIWAAFGEESRADAPRDDEHDEIVRVAAAKPVARPVPAAGFASHRADPALAEPIADLMQATFTDYPSPITTDVIAGQIESGSHVFRCMVDEGGEIVASASAEIDHRRRNAEMTDCATRPDQRGA